MGQSPEELTSQIEDTRRRMAGDLDSLQDRVSPAAIVERRKQAVRGRVGSVRDTIMGSARTAADSAGSASGSATGTASDAVSSAAGSAQAQYAGTPLAAGLVAFGLGAILASLLPASRVEAEAAHRVAEAAKEHGQPVLDDVRSAGQQVAETLKESATDAVGQVKETAQASAQTVKDEGQSAAADVKDDAAS